MHQLLFCFTEWLNHNQGPVTLAVAGIQIWLAWWAVIRPLEQNSTDRENSVLDLLKSEIEQNYSIARTDLKIANDEIAIVDSERTIVEPMQELSNGSKIYFFANLPSKIYTNQDRFKLIQKILESSDMINACIRHREMYKLQNESMTNFSGRLKKIDLNLKTILEDLIKSFEEIKQNWW